MGSTVRQDDQSISDEDDNDDGATDMNEYYGKCEDLKWQQQVFGNEKSAGIPHTPNVRLDVRAGVVAFVVHLMRNH